MQRSTIARQRRRVIGHGLAATRDLYCNYGRLLHFAFVNQDW
jgi:hypothetical protein